MEKASYERWAITPERLAGKIILFTWQTLRDQVIVYSKNHGNFIPIPTFILMRRKRKIYFIFLIHFLMVAARPLLAQPAQIPDEIKPFILSGHEVLDLQTGDINQDNRIDAILICKNKLEDSTWDEFLPRPFLVLIRQANGKLKQVIRNDKAIMGRHEGGVFGDPYQSLDLFTGGFRISFYGGSNWRWVYEYEFRWNPLRKLWVLQYESSESFNSMDMEATMKSIRIDAAELGDWPLEKFRYDGFTVQSKWKVVAAKTYFYDQPKLGSPRRKGFLVKGNTAEATRILKNFVELSYDNGKEITTGYILKKDLQLISKQSPAR